MIVCMGLQDETIESELLNHCVFKSFDAFLIGCIHTELTDVHPSH